MASPSFASSPTNLSSLALLTLLAVVLLFHTCHLATTAKAVRVVKKIGEGVRTLPPKGRLGGNNGPREGPGTGNSPRLNSPPGIGNSPRLDSPPGMSQYTVTRRSYSYSAYNTPGGGQHTSETSNCAVVYSCPRQNETPGSSSQYTVSSTNYDGSYSYVGGGPHATDTSGCTVVSNCSP